VRGAADAHERLAEDVAEAVAGGVDPVAGQQRGLGELLAAEVGRVLALDEPGDVDQPHGLAGGERRDRRGVDRHRRLDRVGQRVGRGGRQLGGRLRGREVRVVDDDRGADVAGVRHARRGAVDPRHLRRAQRRRDRRGAGAVAADAGERLGDVDHAAAAEGDDQLGVADRVVELGGQRVDEAGPDVVDGARALDHVGRRRLRALGRQQDVGVAQEIRGVVDGTAPEADRALAVVPGEVHALDPTHMSV
jgi:hypothetical protein